MAMQDSKDKGCCAPCAPVDKPGKPDKGCCESAQMCDESAFKSKGLVEPLFIPKKTDHDWTLKDHIGELRSRLGSFRDRYTVAPGLYALGEPDKGSDVFVSANYKLSFDILRRSLKGLSAWILVLDTNGVNVWCAAGKGTFGTDELIKKVFETRLHDVVDKKRLIVPQLGAPGISAHEVKKQTGFHVLYGPVEAKDIKDYVMNGYRADKRMRTKEFPIKERAVLVPMELRPASKYFFIYALMVLLLSGASSGSIDLAKAVNGAYPLILLGAGALTSGAVITPLLLPYIPFRSFALKGLLAGVAVTLCLIMVLGLKNPLWLASAMLFFPAISSYLAVQFTGASTYTNISGVKKELKYALPAYIVSVTIAAITFISAKVFEWGLI